jgi:hypothetical protein
MSENLPYVEIGIHLAEIRNKLEKLDLTEAIDKMYVVIMEQLDRINDRLDTIETTVENIEANMPIQEEGNE